MTRSTPRSTRAESRPGPPRTTSRRPSRAFSVSAPEPPSRTSDPAPPVSGSLPASPQIVSGPPVPTIRSPCAVADQRAARQERPAQLRAPRARSRNGRRVAEDPRSATRLAWATSSPVVPGGRARMPTSTPRIAGKPPSSCTSIQKHAAVLYVPEVDLELAEIAVRRSARRRRGRSRSRHMSARSAQAARQPRSRTEVRRRSDP